MTVKLGVKLLQYIHMHHDLKSDKKLTGCTVTQNKCK
jgi:hypothetical protein